MCLGSKATERRVHPQVFLAFPFVCKSLLEKLVGKTDDL